MIEHIEIKSKNVSYQVIIQEGLLTKLTSYLKKQDEIVIVTDDGIPSEYIKLLLKQLPTSFLITVPAGEATKTLETANMIWQKMLENGFTKSTTMIGIGGGMIGDLAGFCASLYLRGIQYIQIPTTLLAQIDASVGGKTAINAPIMKNAIGLIKQPSLVLIDPLTLQTLPKRQLNSGIAEMIKYGLIASKTIFEKLQAPLTLSAFSPLIHECIKIKARIIEQDEQDLGLRQLLNYGHTIGHALEQYSQYKLLHGEAIAIGMLLMAKEKPYYKTLRNLLRKYNLPTTYDYDPHKLLKYIQTDKKHYGSKLNIVLVNDIGKSYIKKVDSSDILNYL